MGSSTRKPENAADRRRTGWICFPLVLLLAVAGCDKAEQSASPPFPPDLARQVATNYADIVHASYRDSLAAAREMDDAISAFLEMPGQQTLQTARQAWIQARMPYGQTEAYRFYNGPVDDADGPEKLLNAWPLDEAYIDHVQGRPDSGIINHPDEYPELSAALLIELNERNGEANISTGFHAVEFLLWGQDLYPESPGRRSFQDYLPEHSPNAERRAQYLRLTTDLLLEHLEYLVDEWSPHQPENYRASFLAAPEHEAIRRIIVGIGSLSGAELAGERLMVAYETKEQEDEHSCFSDTTHLDVLMNARGVQNVYLGRYQRTDGETISGPGLKELIASVDPDLARELQNAIQQSVEEAAKIPPPFDNAMLGADQSPGRNQIKRTIDALRDQVKKLSAAAQALDVQLNLEG